MVVPEQTGSEMADASVESEAKRDSSSGDTLAAGLGDIEVRLPASPTHLPVVRALAADLAVRLDYDLDEVSDLRMAVDEACAEVVALSGPSTRLTCLFRVDPDALSVTVSAPTGRGEVKRGTFGWQVLTALVDEVDTWATDDGVTCVRLVKRHPGNLG